MTAVDRRTVLRSILPGAVVAVAGVAAIGLTVNSAEALPLAAGKINPLKDLPDESLIEKAQVVIVDPWRRRRRWRGGRRWVCWWRRGRRVCGWRW